MSIENIELNIRNRVLEMLIGNCPFEHPDLAIVSLGGSSNSNSGGIRSDIDLTTVMNPKNPAKIDVLSIVQLAQQINRFAKSARESTNIHPVIISTIRLEEAQIALAETFSPNVIPIHWLHYPSLEFAKVNEPPELFLGLMRGISLVGDTNEVVNSFHNSNETGFSHLGGLDWLTDSFRVFLANDSLQPQSFLNGLAMHNLEYFWKWRIVASLFQKETGGKFDSWNDLLEIETSIPREIVAIARKVRAVRHAGVKADPKEIIDLHKLTFDLWPI